MAVSLLKKANMILVLDALESKPTKNRGVGKTAHLFTPYTPYGVNGVDARPKENERDLYASYSVLLRYRGSEWHCSNGEKAYQTSSSQFATRRSGKAPTDLRCFPTTGAFHRPSLKIRNEEHSRKEALPQSTNSLCLVIKLCRIPS